MSHHILRLAAASLLVALTTPAQDVLIADFEGADYGAWTTTGTAFGAGPARGTLPGQMKVSGFRGEGLVNSFCGGDSSVGTLTSPPFVVERRWLTFLIGGGGHEGKTCMNLLVDGRIGFSTAGTNTEPGGSEELAPWAWDLQDLRGKRVMLRIVDDHRGGWGHVNVDHIVLTDTKPELPERPRARVLELESNERYLLLPIRSGGRKTRVDLRMGSRTFRQFDAELARTADEAEFWAFLDLWPFVLGKGLELHLSSAFRDSVALIDQADAPRFGADHMDETLRPQLRFSQAVGWNNDPNGMVYHDGEWHLFFQHNPYGWKWGNMHWGHAVSRDLVHWQQLPIAIYNKRRGDWAFSGGAVVDTENTAGWQRGARPPIVASWTSTGRGECLAYSNDGGRTFVEFAGNPVLTHRGRDPKIIWHEPTRRWVMAVYDEHEDQRCIAFHSSPDLKQWRFESRLPGYYECPEFFELAVDGDADDSRWVVFGADARYALGRFDGREFTPLHDGKHQLHHGAYYASQTFSNAPNGRRIQIGWARIDMPGMPFNQAFTLPHELSLRTTADGVRMFAEPVTELDVLRQRTHAVKAREITPSTPVEVPVAGELFDVRVTIEVGDATAVGLDLGGNRVVYDVGKGQLDGAELGLVDGAVEIRVLVDRPMLELTGNRGRVYVTRKRERLGEAGKIAVFAEGGTARLTSAEVHELRSIWRE